MMMIPGGWESRRPSEARGSHAAIKPPAATTGGSEPPTELQPRGMSNWLELSIVAATLLAAMWFAMTIFFRSPPGLVI